MSTGFSKAKSSAICPVQAQVKFDLVVNLKTARVLGLTIAESFLVRVDEMIEILRGRNFCMPSSTSSRRWLCTLSARSRRRSSGPASAR
jgi:hypothetical protein